MKRDRSGKYVYLWHAGPDKIKKFRPCGAFVSAEKVNGVFFGTTFRSMIEDWIEWAMEKKLHKGGKKQYSYVYLHKCIFPRHLLPEELNDFQVVIPENLLNELIVVDVQKVDWKGLQQMKAGINKTRHLIESIFYERLRKQQLTKIVERYR
jgi:hypothetical protein